MFVVRAFVKPLPEKVPEFDQGPDAVQEVTGPPNVPFHVNVDCPPYATEVGDAVRVTTGTCAGPTPSVTD